MDHLSNERKRILGAISISSLSVSAIRKKITKLRQRQTQQKAKILFLMQGFVNAKESRKLWMKKRHGKFWEMDVPQNDSTFFKESFRMNRESFEILCVKVKGIAKRDTVFRNCIPLKKRVAIALYALRSSAEYETIGRLFGVSKPMVCKILKEFCVEVWKVLALQYLPSNFLTQEKVEECVKAFENIGFPQCLGAIDGCHIEVKPAAEDASDYFNYKGWYSTILFALVDYRYRFMYINVGAPGRCNDSQIFEKSLLKKALQESPVLEENSRNINGVNVPVLLLGDSAFRFSKLVMKPYPFSVAADQREKCFNYHFALEHQN